MEMLGVKLRCSRCDFVLRSTFGCLLGDVKGLQECLSLKGASGSHPCCFCRNVLGRTDYFHHHDYWVHVASTDVTRFDLHTPSSFDEFCTTVMSAVTQVARNQWWTQSSELLGLRTISMPWRSARLHLRSPIYRTLFSHAYYAYVRRRLGNILVTPPTDFCNTLVTFW